MASRIRDTEVQVIIHTTPERYKTDERKQFHTFNIKRLEVEVKELIVLWKLANENKNEDIIKKYRTFYEKFQNKYSKAIHGDDNHLYSIFNLLSSYKSYEDSLERNYLENFIDGLKEFTKVKVIVKEDECKTSIFTSPDKEFAESIEELEELDNKNEDELSRVHKKQLERYLKVRNDDISDAAKIEISCSDSVLNRYTRQSFLNENHAYKILNRSTTYKKCKKFDVLTSRQIRYIAQQINKKPQLLKISRYGLKAVDIVKAFMRLKKVRNEDNYQVVSKFLWEEPP